MKNPPHLLLCVSAVLLSSSALAIATDAVLSRQDIRTFASDPQKVAKLRDAVRILQSRRLDDATAWFNMACIHGFPPNDPQVPNAPANIRALYAQCHRDDYLFFLWHRAYVASIERLMQSAINDPTFRLPYWDWYNDLKLPEAFRSEFTDAARTVRNPLFVKNRNHGVNDGKNIWKGEVETDFNESDFRSFQDALNFGEHGEIHVAVGTPTNMGHPTTAARDPIFWLHHANIDRLLMVWLKRDSAGHHPPATFPTWDSLIYRFPNVGSPNLWIPTVAESALGSMQAMGYEYESNDLTPPPQPLVPTRPPSAPTRSATPHALGIGIEALSVKQALEVGAAATVDLPVPRPAGQKLMMLEANPPESFKAVNVVLSGVSVLSRPEGILSYRVFVNLPREAGRSEQFKDYHVGNISLFALSGSEHHMAGKPVELTFPATKNIAKNVRGAGAAPESISVSLVPVLAPDATPPTKPVLKIDEVRLEGTKSQQ